MCLEGQTPTAAPQGSSSAGEGGPAAEGTQEDVLQRGQVRGQAAGRAGWPKPQCPAAFPRADTQCTLDSNTEDLGTAGFGLSSLLAAELGHPFVYVDGELQMGRI